MGQSVRARVLGFRPLDGLAVLSLTPSLVDQHIMGLAGGYAAGDAAVVWWWCEALGRGCSVRFDSRLHSCVASTALLPAPSALHPLLQTCTPACL